MPTARAIIYNFRNILSGGKPNRDRGFSDRQILYIARVCRNFLVASDIKKEGAVPVQYEQDLGCVRLEDCDQADCDLACWGTKVKKVKIPPILDLPDNMGLTFFGLIDKRTPIYVPSLQYGNLTDYVPFKKKVDRVGQMIGDWIYVKETGDLYSNGICMVNIRGVMADPTLAQTFGATGFTPRCFDLDTDNYPIPPDLEDAMYNMMFTRYAQIMSSAPADIQNDEKRESVA